MERLRDQPERPERMRSVLAAPPTASLPTHARLLAEVTEAEQAESWLLRCVANDTFLALNVSMVETLAAVLSALGDGPVLEVAAGRGELAAALAARKIDVIPTDASPPTADGYEVLALDAASAVRRFRPGIVLGSFVPADCGAELHVLSSASVRHFITLNARLGWGYGSSALWQAQGWRRILLEDVTRFMVTRHDVWLGNSRPLLQHGEAWLFSRERETSRSNPRRVVAP